MFKGKYVYCIIEGKPSGKIDLTGMGGHGKVYFIEYENIAVAVSDTPLRVYEPVRENAMLHEKVIGSLMNQYNLVPCSFGSVFKSKEDCIVFIRDAYPYIFENLEKVRGKMELGLRIFWKKEAFSKEIETANIRAFKNKLQFGEQSKSQLLRAEFGRMVEEQVNERRQYYIRNIYEPIAEKAEDARLNDPITPKMVLNAAFLIKKESVDDFDKTVEETLKKFEDIFEISYTGPWPPYNFTSIVPES